jgi:hypothetical protein
MPSAAAAKQETPELDSFAADYNIVGGLRSHVPTQRYLARRRSDGQDVVITIARVLAEDDNNSLAHLATDAQLLRTLSHPNIARVLDGRWIGPDTFATVTERFHGDTVQELLDRGRQFPNTRVAILLEDVHAALDWARQQGIIHRGVNPEEMVFERGTNRLIITLTRTLIPINGVPDATSDARSIGRLAWTLLSGEDWSPETEQELCKIVPNLAKRVADDTMMMSRLKDGAPVPDVMAYIGVVAAGDVLKRAEIDLIALKDEVTEWRDTEYRRFERRKRELEEKARADATALAKERDDFKKFESDERAAIAAERAELESNAARRQKRLTEVRDELEAQRRLLEQRLGELEARRLEVDQLHQEALEASRAASAAIAIKPRTLSPIDRVVAVAAGPERKQPEGPKDWRGYVRWLMPSVSVALLMLVIALGIGLAHRSHRAAPSVVQVNGSKIISAPPAGLDTTRDSRGGFLSQSSGGRIIPPTGVPVTGPPVSSPSVPGAVGATPSSVVPPIVSPDSADSTFMRDSIASAKADSAAAARRRAAARRLAQLRRDSLARDSIARSVRRDTIVRPDTAYRRDTIVPRDGFLRHDTVVPRDTIARPDTLVRSDTATRRDTLSDDRRGPRADRQGLLFRP